MDYDRITNAVNIKIYAAHKIKDSAKYRHKCVLCGELTSIDNSISNQGDRLICNRCVRRKFDSVMDAFAWCECREDERGK